MKLAITSTDGVHVNEHFGMARKFYIYEYGQGKTQFLEKRQPVDIYSLRNKNHPYDHDRFMMVLKVIEDCQLVFTKRIGPAPIEKLQEHGIEPVVFEGNINEVFQMLPKA